MAMDLHSYQLSLLLSSCKSKLFTVKSYLDSYYYRLILLAECLLDCVFFFLSASRFSFSLFPVQKNKFCVTHCDKVLLHKTLLG